MNNKGNDQTAQMRRLVCTFVVRKPQRQVFWPRGRYVIVKHVCLSSVVRDLDICLSLYLHPCFVCMSSEGSVETAQMGIIVLYFK